MQSKTIEKFKTYLSAKYPKKIGGDILCRCKRLEVILNIDIENNIKSKKDYLSISSKIDAYMLKNQVPVLRRYAVKGTLMYSLRAFLRFNYKSGASDIIAPLY